VTGPGEVEEVPGIFPHGGTLLYSPGGLQGFDSLAVDGDGNVCLATLVNGGISVVEGQSGELVEFVQTDDILTTNICFGGENLTTAYLTLSGTGRLVSTVWPRPGLALAHSA
jgi:gluconolactonase